MTIKLTKHELMEQLQALKPDLAERFTVSQIGIFGSVARDEVRPDSDIDIVVHMQPDLLKRARLKAELEQILGIEVDVIRYRTSMNPYLKAQIDRDVIYV